MSKIIFILLFFHKICLSVAPAPESKLLKEKPICESENLEDYFNNLNIKIEESYLMLCDIIIRSVQSWKSKPWNPEKIHHPKTTLKNSKEFYETIKQKSNNAQIPIQKLEFDEEGSEYFLESLTYGFINLPETKNGLPKNLSISIQKTGSIGENNLHMRLGFNIFDKTGFNFAIYKEEFENRQREGFIIDIGPECSNPKQEIQKIQNHFKKLGRVLN